MRGRPAVASSRAAAEPGVLDGAQPRRQHHLPPPAAPRAARRQGQGHCPSAPRDSPAEGPSRLGVASNTFPAAAARARRVQALGTATPCAHRWMRAVCWVVSKEAAAAADVSSATATTGPALSGPMVCSFGLESSRASRRPDTAPHATRLRAAHHGCPALFRPRPLGVGCNAVLQWYPVLQCVSPCCQHLRPIYKELDGRHCTCT